MRRRVAHHAGLLLPWTRNLGYASRSGRAHCARNGRESLVQGVHPIRDMPALPVGTLPEEEDVPQVRLGGPPQLHAQVLKPEMQERLDCVRELRETQALLAMRHTGVWPEKVTVTLLRSLPRLRLRESNFTDRTAQAPAKTKPSPRWRHRAPRSTLVVSQVQVQEE
jgi:hypothetical protein